jgi:hypothetical protein
MFAVASPGGVDPGTMEKTVQVSSALDAEFELFYCAFDADVARPGRFATRGAHEDIHQFVEQRHQQLEYNAQRLRAWGVRVRTSIRWDSPTYQGIVRQVLRHKPKLLIVQSTRRGRAGRLLPTHTDYKLIESCSCPLLLIKTQRPYANPSLIAAVDPEHGHNKPAALDDEILGSTSLDFWLLSRLGWRRSPSNSSRSQTCEASPLVCRIPKPKSGRASARR